MAEDQGWRLIVAWKLCRGNARAKAKFILATDGVSFEAEDMVGGETVACAYKGNKSCNADLRR